MTELEIRRLGWGVECRRPLVNNPAGELVARLFAGSSQIGLGMSARSMDDAVADA